METKLKVIEGGLRPKEDWPRYFVSAYITDTRLMGAMGMYIHWRAMHDDLTEDLHQFFYFETEETGFESYVPLWTQDSEEVLIMEKENMGGLGGKKVDLELAEAKQILKFYCDFNKGHGLPLPGDEHDYIGLTKDLEPLDEAGHKALLEKICTPVEHPYELINYYLMRCFGKDFFPASLLTADGSMPEDICPENGIATMCRNTISEGEDAGTYLCTSLLELPGRYELVTTTVRVDGMKISSCVKTSQMTISPEESAMILARPEFITVFTIIPDMSAADIFEDTDEDSEEVFELPGAEGSGIFSFTADYDTVSDVYENGTLFFSFKNNNAHVNSNEFLLSGDVKGIYFVSDTGQLLVMAYDRIMINVLETELMSGDMADSLVLTDRYEFKDPVLYDFIGSGFDDFNDFVDAIRLDGE